MNVGVTHFTVVVASNCFRLRFEQEIISTAFFVECWQQWRLVELSHGRAGAMIIVWLMRRASYRYISTVGKELCDIFVYRKICLQRTTLFEIPKSIHRVSFQQTYQPLNRKEEIVTRNMTVLLGPYFIRQYIRLLHAVVLPRMCAVGWLARIHTVSTLGRRCLWDKIMTLYHGKQDDVSCSYRKVFVVCCRNVPVRGLKTWWK